MSATMNGTEVYTGIAIIYREGNASVNGSSGVLNFSSPLDKVTNIFTVIILFITMISLGCTMEISKIKAHFFKPKAPAIALLAQFGIMPLTAFCLARILQMDPIKAVTVLICGCCPGGSLSNIFALAIKGDMNLSIVMTTCSSFAALGLMPLLLYIFCQGFNGLENAIPYAGIITALALTLVPCSVGIAINHYKPNYSPVVKKVRPMKSASHKHSHHKHRLFNPRSRKLGTLTILFTLVLFLLAALEHALMHQMMFVGLCILIITGLIVFILSGVGVKDVLWIALKPDILGVAALMPLIGFLLGYVMSFTCGLSAQCSRTISMETGCQNIQLCFAILKVAFPPQVIGPMFLFPLIYIIFQCTEALLLVMCFRCYQKFKAPAEDINQSADVKQEEVKQP